MKRFWFGTTIAAATALTFGCNSKPASTSPSATTNSGTASTAAAVAVQHVEPVVTGAAVQSLTPASEAVALFLENLRVGNAAQATALLTQEAQAELSRRDYELNQIGSPQSSFQVGRTQFADSTQQAALVECEFSEPAGDAGLEKTETVFEVHLEGTAWRIKGFAVDMGADQPEAVIDFEDLPASDAPPSADSIAQNAAAVTAAPSGTATPQVATQSSGQNPTR